MRSPDHPMLNLPRATSTSRWCQIFFAVSLIVDFVDSLICDPLTVYDIQ